MKTRSFALAFGSTGCLAAWLPIYAFAQNRLDYRNEKADERISLEKDKQTALAIEIQTVLAQIQQYFFN